MLECPTMSSHLSCRPFLVIAPILLPLLACGSDSTSDDAGTSTPTCARETRADKYEANMTKPGGNLSIRLVEANPAPPAKGDNTWTFELFATQGNVLITASSTITVVPVMPGHGLATAPASFKAEPIQPPGRFRVGPMNLPRDGLWEVTFTAQVPMTTDEQMVFPFCLGD